MIVTVSTTSFPGNMVKAYKSSRPFAFFYILNTFVVNMMMLNLILATFYFYYQNFYTESVKKLNSKKNLL
jgi:multisubunit Na+/H+ antiporter MnhC subunit